MLTNRREIQIEWGDCDPFGIVFFPRYFEYFDACTNALFHRALGYPKAEMLRRFKIAGITLVEASCNIKVTSSYGEIVAEESCVCARMHREGLQHHGVELRFGGEGHRVYFQDLVGKSITVYAQQEVVKDLIAARLRYDAPIFFEAEAMRISDFESRPRIH